MLSEFLLLLLEFRDREKMIEETDTHISCHIISFMSYGQKIVRHPFFFFFLKWGCEPLCWLKVHREVGDRLIFLLRSSCLDIASNPRQWWFVCQCGTYCEGTYNLSLLHYQILRDDLLCITKSKPAIYLLNVCVPSKHHNSNKKLEHRCFFQVKARHAFFFSFCFVNKAKAGGPTWIFLLLWRIPANQSFSTLLNFLLMVKLFFGWKLLFYWAQAIYVKLSMHVVILTTCHVPGWFVTVEALLNFI